jgi:hypothetical protein
MAGPDRAIHIFTKGRLANAMDCRVKPGNDGTGNIFGIPFPVLYDTYHVTNREPS